MPPIFSAFFDPSVGANYCKQGADRPRDGGNVGGAQSSPPELRFRRAGPPGRQHADRRFRMRELLGDLSSQSQERAISHLHRRSRLRPDTACTSKWNSAGITRSVEYTDPRFSIVVFVSGIPGVAFREDSIVALKPLAITARRAGWQGCSLNIDGLPQVRIVEPAGLAKPQVRLEWRAAAG